MESSPLSVIRSEAECVCMGGGGCGCQKFIHYRGRERGGLTSVEWPAAAGSCGDSLQLNKYDRSQSFSTLHVVEAHSLEYLFESDKKSEKLRVNQARQR